MHSWIAANLILRPAYALLGQEVAKFASLFEKTQWQSKQELASYQRKCLERMLRLAFENVPYYRKKFRESGIKLDGMDPLEVVSRLPVLSKDDVRGNVDTLIAPVSPLRSTTKMTSGSTGVPIIVKKDGLASGVMNAIMWRNYKWFGIKIGDRQARVWAGPTSWWEHLKMRGKDTLQNRIRLSTFVISRKALEEFVGRLCKFRPHYLYGYAQSLYRLASYVLDEKINLAELNLKAVVSTGEMLYDHQLETMEKAFVTKVVNEYGCTEVGIIGMLCGGGKMHVMGDGLLIEILKNECPAGPGEEGEIVVTELYNSLMPLIRYKVGDRGIVSNEACGCGRGLPVLKKLSGRVTDLIVCPNGTTVDPYIVDFLLRKKPEYCGLVRQWVVERKDNSGMLVTLCIDGAGRKREIELYLREGLLAICGKGLDLEFAYADWLQVGPSGKTRITP